VFRRRNLGIEGDADAVSFCGIGVLLPRLRSRVVGEPRRSYRAWLVRVAAIGSVSALMSCAADLGHIQPGMSRAQVVARFGAPTLDVPDSTGEIMIYSSQPLGQRVYRAKLDVSGIVRSVDQTLSMEGFSRVQPGQWNKQRVKDEFGPPADVRYFGGHEVWEYRYKDNGTLDALMSISFDGQGQVIKLENGQDPMKDPNIH